MRLLSLVVLAAALTQGDSAAPAAYTPAPAREIPGYFAEVMPCEIIEERDEIRRDRVFVRVECQGDLLSSKSLRELSILRNTIFARYGWDGYRKKWLRDYFHAQPWFKSNPRFHYGLISEADRKNAHIIATWEASLTDRTLLYMEAEVYARRGKVWNDVHEWTWADGTKVRACEMPKDFEGEWSETMSWDCTFKGEPWYKPNPKFSNDDLTAEDRIEIGLTSRMLGLFAVDDDARGKAEQSLDKLLQLSDLRQLSLRDLRLLRNTIYARRGRSFKSPVLAGHFHKRSWYKENPEYSDALLTRTDHRNVQLIQSVEDEQGGALGDKDWLIEPALDLA